MTKKVYYPKKGNSPIILAEPNTDDSWSVESEPGFPNALEPDIFDDQFTLDVGKPFRKFRSNQEVPEPNAILEQGGHRAVLIHSRDELYSVWDTYPTAVMYEAEHRRVFTRGDQPHMWAGFRRVGEEIIHEKNEVYFFPYVGLIEDN